MVGAEPGQTILNRLIELSATPVTSDILYTALVVRPFKTIFGTDVKAVTLMVGKNITLLDAEGHVLTEFVVPENSSLPAFEPE